MSNAISRIIDSCRVCDFKKLTPKVSFQELVKMMVESDLKAIKNKN